MDGIRANTPLVRLIIEEWKWIDKWEMRDQIEDMNAHRETTDSHIRSKRGNRLVLDTDMILDLDMWQNELDKRGLVNGIRLA